MANKPTQFSLSFNLSKGEKIYFASDFHLGAPDKTSSRTRELKIIRWLDIISMDAKGIFLVGDLFDFWFEYKRVIPKGFVRFQGKLAELRDRGIPIFIFPGNHDMWMFDYFPEEFDIQVIDQPISFQVNERKIYVGHGDGLGPGHTFYKFLKIIFSNRFSQWLFHWIHPNIGIWIAQYWSKVTRATGEEVDDPSNHEKEVLLHYCKHIERNQHHDLYVFGHRHLPLQLDVSDKSTYFGLGEWIYHFTYLELDEKGASLKSFDD